MEAAAQKWLDAPIGTLTSKIPPEEKLSAALYGSRVADLFNAVQLEKTGADFSCTSLGNDPLGFHKDITMREITAAYQFTNTVMVLEVTKETIRESLERVASYFDLKGGKPVISERFLKPKVEHYNYDYWANLDYAFDLRKPLGSRVVRMKMLDGTELEDDRTYTLTTSNYRATGTGGYPAQTRCRTSSRTTSEDTAPSISRKTAGSRSSGRKRSGLPKAGGPLAGPPVSFHSFRNIGLPSARQLPGALSFLRPSGSFPACFFFFLNLRIIFGKYAICPSYLCDFPAFFCLPFCDNFPVIAPN